MVATKQESRVNSQYIKMGYRAYNYGNSQRQAETKEKKITGDAKQIETNKMAVVSPHISIITLNVNRLNLTKGHRIAGWIKNKAQLYAANSRLISYLKTHSLKV